MTGIDDALREHLERQRQEADIRRRFFREFLDRSAAERETEDFVRRCRYATSLLRNRPTFTVSEAPAPAPDSEAWRLVAVVVSAAVLGSVLTFALMQFAGS